MLKIGYLWIVVQEKLNTRNEWYTCLVSGPRPKDLTKGVEEERRGLQVSRGSLFALKTSGHMTSNRRQTDADATPLRFKGMRLMKSKIWD